MGLHHIAVALLERPQRRLLRIVLLFRGGDGAHVSLVTFPIKIRLDLRTRTTPATLNFILKRYPPLTCTTPPTSPPPDRGVRVANIRPMLKYGRCDGCTYMAKTKRRGKVLFYLRSRGVPNGKTWRNFFVSCFLNRPIPNLKISSRTLIIYG